MNGHGRFRFPPGPRLRPPFPHELDILRARAAQARAEAGFGTPNVRGPQHIPRQGAGNPWDEDGSDRLPPPGWHQNPESDVVRSVTPLTAEAATVRWGDTKELSIKVTVDNRGIEPLGTYLCAIDLAMPAVGILRLSVTSPDIAAITAGWVCDWLMQTGVGQSQFEELHHVSIAPSNGTAPTTLILQLPVQSLRVTATITSGANVGDTSRVTVNAQWAPMTAYPDLVRLISNMNKE